MTFYQDCLMITPPCKIIILTICSLFSLPALSSEIYRKYDVTSGLSENSVLDIMQDPKGYMWFATKDGLNRFDGNKFIKYADWQESNVLNIERICMHRDSLRIWVAGTRQLFLFDPSTEKFTPFMHPSGRIYPILCLEYDDIGNLWLGAKDRILKWDESRENLEEYDIRTDGKGTNFVRTIFKDSRGNIWAGTQEGLCRYIAGKDRFSSFHKIKSSGRNQQDNEITAISEDYGNNLWVGTRSGIFSGFNVNSKEFTVCPSPFDLGRIHIIFDYSETELIVGSDNGLFFFNRYTREWRRSDSRLGKESIYDCYRDRENGLWIGTYFSGVSYLSPKHDEIEWYYDDDSPESLSGNAVSQFCEGTDGSIWIATETGGLNRFDRKTGRFTHFPDKTHSNLHALYLDGEELWIGTFSQGLDIMDIRTGKVRRYRHNIADPSSLPNDHVYSIFKASDGTVYIGTLGGLCRYVPETDGFLPEKGLGQVFVFDIAEDAGKNLWAATKGRGLFRKGTDGRWLNIRTSSDRFNRIYMDTDSTLWFCSEDKGIYRYDRIADTLAGYSYRQGLPRCTYYGMLDDGNGSLWLSSNSGIIRYRPDSASVQVYTIENGLQSNQFNYKSSMKSSDGKFWFGGINGFNSFYPQDLTVNRILPNVEISSVTIPSGETLDARTRIIVNGDRITIPHGVPYFDINFESLSFVAPGQNRYAWKISELHKEWNHTDSPFVSLTGLAAGHYHFLVKGSNNDGYWSDNTAELEIRIEPAPYMTLWAKLAYFVIAAVAVWLALYRWSRTNEEKKKQQLNNEKMTFFTQVAHEIKTSVTLISAPLDRIMEDDETKADRENLQLVRKNVDRLLDLVRQFLDYRKIDKDGYCLQFSRTDIKMLSGTVIESFRALDKGISIREEIPDEAMIFNVNPDAMTKILSNLLSNASNYAEKAVTVKIGKDSERGGFTITVSDDGPGIPEEAREKVFEPFYQASRSAGQGFGIGLSIVRLLAEKHGGTVFLNGKYKDGCEIGVYIPAIGEASATVPDTKSDRQYAGNTRKHEWTVMIVEDTDDMRKFISDALSDSYDTHAARNGDEAISYLTEHSVDLIISDIKMPGMDGFGLLQAVRENGLYCHIPFILLSALDSVDDKIRGLDYGADAYMEKPFTVKHLKATVNNLLENRKRLFARFAGDPDWHYETGQMNSSDAGWLEKLDSVIRENLTNEEFNIDMLAEEMAMSRSNLHRRLKGVTGTTPNDYIKIFRLKSAAVMLKNGGYRVNEICDLVGFYNRSYFAKCFYEQFGIHPKDYNRK